MMRFLTSVADAIDWLVDTISPRDRKASVFTTPRPTATPMRVYTIRYAPRTSTTFFAVEHEIVDWKTEVIDHVDGSVECVTTPVYAECAPRAPVETILPEYETIETTEALDVATLLAQKDVLAVTWEEIAPTVSTVETEEPTSECDGDEQDGDGDVSGVAEVELLAFCHSPFGLQLAVHALVRQLMDAC